MRLIQRPPQTSAVAAPKAFWRTLTVVVIIGFVVQGWYRNLDVTRSVVTWRFNYTNEEIPAPVSAAPRNTTTCDTTSSNLVNGVEFSIIVPNTTIDVWNHPDDTHTDEDFHPSNFSQLCAAGSNLSPSIHAPPRYQRQHRPKGLRIAMIGDSLMRYQYLMLIHYLHTGHWVHSSMHPNLMRETSFGGSWSIFYPAVTKYFGENYTICDCFRASNNPRARNPTMVENQFYFDQGCYDNAVAMLSKLGDLGFRGYHTPSEISNWFQSNDDNTTKLEVPLSTYRRGQFVWKYGDYETFFRNFLTKLEPPPRVVVINEGIWTVENLSNETVVRQIQDTIRELGMISVYKTTTKPLKPNPGPGLLPHDELCCKIFDHCLRVDWTACVPQEDFIDNYHFYSYPNIRFNEQLFEILESIGEMSTFSSMEL